MAQLDTEDVPGADISSNGGITDWDMPAPDTLNSLGDIIGNCSSIAYRWAGAFALAADPGGYHTTLGTLDLTARCT